MTTAPTTGGARPRIAVIGAGAFGEQHLRVIDDRWELVAVADVDAERARLVAERHRVPAYFTDVDELLREARPDAVIIATTPTAHPDLAQAAIAANCTVLLEKPVAVSAHDADRLVRHDVAGRVLPGHVLRFDPAYIWLREQVRAGAIGAVLGVSARRDRERGHLERYAHTHLAFLTAIHDIDLALWITDDAPRSVTAHTASDHGAHPALFALTGAADNGAVWSVRTAWVLPPGAPPSDRFEVYGTDGVAAVEVAGDRVHLHLAAATTTTTTRLVDETAALRAENAHLHARTIDPATEPVVTLAEALMAVAVAEAAVESAERGGTSVTPAWTEEARH